MKAATDQAKARATALEQCTANLEESANTHSDDIATLNRQVAKLKQEVASLMAKSEDLEARSHRCNLRIFGVKEGRGHGVRPTTFVAEMLGKALKMDKPPVLDRALRTLQKTPEEGQQPQAFVIRCHYYQEKEEILRRASATANLVTEQGDRI